MSNSKALIRRKKIRMRIRKRIMGTAQRPRLSVYRSSKEIYAQIIDDSNGKTLVSASSLKDTVDAASNKVDQSKQVGKLIAEKAVAAGISQVVFDRNGYLYHGRIKSLAEGAREGGLLF
jgi:large subunit ribosomal protein L18